VVEAFVKSIELMDLELEDNSTTRRLATKVELTLAQ
jgi:hypothetical protein